MQNVLEELEKKCVDTAKTAVTEDIHDVQQALEETRKKAADELDREARKNIIIYRATESRSVNPKDGAQADKNFVMRLFNDVQKVGVQAADIKRLFRLGRHSERDRPLLIEFRNRQIKNLVMECLGSLQDASEEFRGLSVTHDMTRAEREQCKECVQEAKECARQDVLGEWRYVVRGNPGLMQVIRLRKTY